MSPKIGSLGGPHAGAAAGLHVRLGLTGIMTPRGRLRPPPHLQELPRVRARHAEAGRSEAGKEERAGERGLNLTVII